MASPAATRKGTKATRADESSESRAVIEHGFAVARALGIRKILIQADELREQRWVQQHRRDETLIWLSRGDKAAPPANDKTSHAVQLPGHALSRMDQIQIGLMTALATNRVEPTETVLILTGLVGSHRLDGILIANPERDYTWLRGLTVSDLQGKSVRSKSFFKLLDIALRFSTEGREGKPIGTTFVLGEPKCLKRYLRQMILNPCRGHPQRIRNIHAPDFLETLRELAALDGAFVVSPQGVVERAGAFLSPPPVGRKVRVRQGQGARHTSACAVTAACDALAIVLSESSSSVTVYHRGSTILELNQRR